MTPDYYALLDVVPEAEPEVIRAAYLVLAKLYHPDMATAASLHNVENFRLITEAYETLRDPNRRAQYDRDQALQQPYMAQHEQFAGRAAREQVQRNQRGRSREREHRQARARGTGQTSPNNNRSAPATPSSQTKVETGKHGAATGNTERAESRSTVTLHNLLVFSVGAFALAALVFGLTRLLVVPAGSPPNIDVAMTDNFERLLGFSIADESRQTEGKQSLSMEAITTRENASSKRADANAIALKANCTAADGTGFSLSNQNGFVDVAYNGAASVRANVDIKNAEMMVLSKIEPLDRVAIVLMKGKKNGTVIMVSDAVGNPIETIGAECSDAAF